MTIATINAKTFVFDQNPSPDSAKYTGVNHTSAVKDYIQVRRVSPKVTKTDNGVAREYHKRVISEVIGGVTKDLICETVYSIPVGASAANITALRADNAAFATSASGIALVDKGTINF